MIRIDDTLLEEIGLISLPKEERDQLLRQIYETLEMRVGMKLAERMTDQQLDEFERFIDTNDEAGALKWLEGNFPDYKQVVANELEKLKVEIKRDAPQLVEAIRQGATPSASSVAQPSQSQQPAVSSVNPQYGPTPQQFNQQPVYADMAQSAQSQPMPAQSSSTNPPVQPQQFQPEPSQQYPAASFGAQPSTQPTQSPIQDNNFTVSSGQDDSAGQSQDSTQQTGSIPPPPAF